MRIRKCLAGAIICALTAFAALAEGTIAIRGEGAVSAPPDIVTIRIGVETWAKTAVEALRENSAEAEAFIAVAKERGVAPADIQTQGVSLFPLYDNSLYESMRSGREDAPKLDGFKADNGLTIRLRDVASAGETIGALVGAGANRLHGIEFGLADDREQRDAARRAAVADAQRKARLYAEAAGVALGPIVSIEEENVGIRPRMAAMAMSERAGSVPMEAGEANVTASVRIVWRIAE